MGKVCIIFSTYNSADYVEACLVSCFEQDYEDIHIIIADDGSTDRTVELLKRTAEGKSNFRLIELEHGERGIARNEAIKQAKELGADYLYIIDSDMVLEKELVSKCLVYLKENPHIGGLVIPESAYSNYENFYSKVKVFERNIINNAGENLGKNSIEAVRFWRMDAYEKTGGINVGQISFEETQPTIRYLEQGGQVKRATFTFVYHDEKHVTLRDLINKKRYYFSVMDKTISTEKSGFLKALTRWYFFRPVLYRPQNLKKYIEKPILTIGMFYMYFLLTIVGVFELLKTKIKS